MIHLRCSLGLYRLHCLPVLRYIPQSDCQECLHFSLESSLLALKLGFLSGPMVFIFDLCSATLLPVPAFSILSGIVEVVFSYFTILQLVYPLETFSQNMSSEVATFKGTPFHFQAIKPSLDPVLLFFLGPLLCPWSPVIELSFITSSSAVLCFVRKCLRRFGPSYPHVWSGHFFTE